MEGHKDRAQPADQVRDVKTDVEPAGVLVKGPQADEDWEEFVDRVVQSFRAAGLLPGPEDE